MVRRPDDDLMVKELAISNSTGRDLRLGVRKVEDAWQGPKPSGRDYAMWPGAEWCIHAPGRNASFAVQIGPDVIVVLVGGCDIDAVDIIEHPTTESPARPIVPIDGY